MRRRFCGAASALALASCTLPPEAPCERGICVADDAGETRDGSRATPDGSRPRGDSAIACVEAWSCTAWQTDGASDLATRSCTDENACGTQTLRPIESATLPDLDFEFYECNVEPIFDRGCAHQACHGTEEDRAFRVYARGRLRIAGETWIEPAPVGGCGGRGTPKPSEACVGSIECYCWTLPHSDAEWRRNFDSARAFALDSEGAPLADMTRSELLRQPEIGGGFSHQNIHFWRAGDAEHQTILSWLEGAALGRACDSRN